MPFRSRSPALPVPRPQFPWSRAASRDRGHGRPFQPSHSGNWRKGSPACCDAWARRRVVLSALDDTVERVSTAHRAKLA